MTAEKETGAGIISLRYTFPYTSLNNQNGTSLSRFIYLTSIYFWFQSGGSYSNVLIVQKHPKMMTAEDESFKVICDKSSLQVSLEHVADRARGKLRIPRTPHIREMSDNFKYSAAASVRKIPDCFEVPNGRSVQQKLAALCFQDKAHWILKDLMILEVLLNEKDSEDGSRSSY